MMKFSIPTNRLAAMTAFLLVVAPFLNACDATPESLARPNMTALSVRVQPLFAKTKTVCFGRFMVDVPVTADVVFGPTDIDWPIDHFPGEADKVEQHVTRLLEEVEKERIYLRPRSEFVGPKSMFGKVIDGAIPGQKLVFGSKDHVSYSIYSITPVGKDLFVQYAGSVSSTDDEIRILNAVARNLRPRTDDEIPAEPGACIEGGFVTLQSEFERAALGVRLREFPDVHFSVEVTKNQDHVVESSALEPRLQDAEKAGGNWYSRVKFLRRGPRQLGDWKGYEALAWKPAKQGTESHEFAFVSLGAPRDPLQPGLDIKLDTGVKDNRTASTKPSLTDEEAVAVWDKITSSIRVRPVGGKSSATGTPRTPLGSLVHPSSICPESGWWHCTSTEHAAGEKRRHFVAGDLMPHMVFFDKASVWQKLAGERPTVKKSAAWQLQEYDPQQET